MEFRYDELAGYKKKSVSELGYEAYKMIYFWGEDKDLDKIKDFIINNFITYKHDGAVNFKEHEVFLWTTNGHFHITLNGDKNTPERMSDIFNILKTELETNFNHLDVTVEFGKDYILEKLKIEDFLNSYVLDINNLPINKFSTIDICSISFPKISKESIDNFYRIEREFFKTVEDKAITINNTKGKFKRINYDGTNFGFFKLRAKKVYYPIGLSDIREIIL